MLIVIDNFFTPGELNLVTEEVKKLEFYGTLSHPESESAEEIPNYPGTRTDTLINAHPLLDSFIIRKIERSGTPFAQRPWTQKQYAHLRLEQDNAGEYIHQDLDDWAYLIYLSETNLDSGTKMYESVKSVPTVRMSSFSEKDKEKDKEHTLVRFVQNRIVMFDSLIPHMAWNNHGNDMSDGRLTINGFCLYDNR